MSRPWAPEARSWSWNDMSGNLREWCEDRMLRWGPWCMGPDTVTTACAGREDAERADDKFGFRIVVP